MQTASSCIGMRRFPFAACAPAAFLAALGLSQLACGESKKAESKSASESNMQPGLFTVPQDQLMHLRIDRKSTRLNSQSPCNLVCRLLLEKKKKMKLRKKTHTTNNLTCSHLT